jgi:hypothetical protein
MTRHTHHPNLGLSIYVTLCCVGAAAFAVWMYALLVPIRAENPGLAAYKPPPAAVVNYRPATLPAASPRDALTVVPPGLLVAPKDIAVEAPARPALQRPAETNTAPAVAPRTRTAAPKRQATVRRTDPRQKANEFAFQPFFGGGGGGFRPWN